MEVMTPYVVDKSGWGEGPWMKEPDRIDFVFAGLAGLALRHPHHGYWCGYVGVPREHPLYARRWDDPSGLGVELETARAINYSAACDGVICHVPSPGMPDDVWWLGFDCGSTWDLAPGMRAHERARGWPPIEEMIDTPEWLREEYRPLPWVRTETEHLAAQLAALMSAGAGA